MGKIYTKTIHGRKYLYERIGSKRVGGKVVTDDDYLGAVDPVQDAFSRMEGFQKDVIKTAWLEGEGVGRIADRINGFVERNYAKSTVRKWCIGNFGKRDETCTK